MSTQTSKGTPSSCSPTSPPWMKRISGTTKLSKDTTPREYDEEIFATACEQRAAGLLSTFMTKHQMDCAAREGTVARSEKTRHLARPRAHGRLKEDQRHRQRANIAPQRGGLPH